MAAADRIAQGKGIKQCPTCRGTMQQLHDSRKARKIWKCMTGCGAEEEIEVEAKAEPEGRTSTNGLQSLAEYAGLTGQGDEGEPTSTQPEPIAPIRAPTAPLPVHQPMPTRSPDLQDYEGPMLSKLRALISQIPAQLAQVEAWKAEAERLHAALGALGTKGVPEIPWVKPKLTRKSKAPAAPAALIAPVADPDDMTCGACGRTFENRYQYKIGPGGKKYCKGHECRPRKEA